MVGPTVELVARGPDLLERQSREDHLVWRPVADHSMPNVPKKILQILHN